MTRKYYISSDRYNVIFYKDIYGDHILSFIQGVLLGFTQSYICRVNRDYQMLLFFF